MTHAVLTTTGVVVALVVAQDVFTTVLFPASGHGLIRKPLGRLVWHAFKAGGRLVGERRRRGLFAYAGPVQILASILVWFGLLVGAFAAVYQPALGEGINADSGPTDTSWATALYVSGFALTTLGTGDVAPRESVYRLLTVAEAALGFFTVSMVVTYFLSVYGSLVKRNAFAEGLHHRTARSGDAVEILVGLVEDGRLSQVRAELGALAGSLRQIHQSHRSYPVLRYFHYRQTWYALPRILLITHDLAALVATVPDDGPGEPSRRRWVGELDAATKDLTDELVPQVDRRPATPHEVEAWSRRHEDARRRLAELGVAVASDADRAAGEYVVARSRWQPAVETLARAMLYDWTTIAGDALRHDEADVVRSPGPGTPAS